MNETIEQLRKHCSIRAYTDQPVSEEQLRAIVTSAQAASTSSFVQAYSIIGVRDRARKARLAELAGGQKHVEQCPLLLVFCLDLHRLELCARLEGFEPERTETALESTEQYTVGVVDAALAAQNAAIAAESLGLGICYIGGLRNRPKDVAELLKTPERVVPLFGMTVGRPAEPAATKPRLAPEAVYSEEFYPADEEALTRLTEYNGMLSAYYRERTGGGRADRWSEQMTLRLSRPSRLDWRTYLTNRGLPLK
ncbi:oxygen-insensitive NADPH nitroreductase [Cohnella fermenti]|uniref:Oxygen-insensitive NADPH nitroreductase n=1 Tax=Cohnella fermenti TaxID=2565925 RepID=A0A4S4BWL1_9BACL|nr:oxygen-insensitive NADPH nitroreductase [Cohnella fermenti]THF79573.1 oxygen-insensitive NADPH nitroreductase [Cohnella fermenti]